MIKIWERREQKCPRWSHFLHLVDGALRGPEVDRVRWWHVEGLGFAIEAGALGGHAQAALAGGDDLRDELLAIYADLHGDPVLSKLLGKLRLILWPAIFAAATTAVLRQPKDREKYWINSCNKAWHFDRSFLSTENETRVWQWHTCKHFYAGCVGYVQTQMDASLAQQGQTIRMPLL